LDIGHARVPDRETSKPCCEVEEISKGFWCWRFKRLLDELPNLPKLIVAPIGLRGFRRICRRAIDCAG
jgi:hypothetical protein